MKLARHALVLVLLAGCSTTTPQATPSSPTDAGSDASPDVKASYDASAPDVGADGWAPDAGFASLFDGTTFANWDRYLGIPNGETTALGLENDPRGVYSIVKLDGEPAIRISGEVWGALISKKELSNFELRLEYKWGTKVYPPLNYPDSGIMVLSTGPLGAVNAGGDPLSNPIGSGAFMVSIEYQLAPGNIGGLYNLGPIDKVLGGRNNLAEKPEAWNRAALVVHGSASEHYLDGQLVASATGYKLRMPGQPVVPLDRGKIQLQSEGGEIYFRRIELRSLE